MSSIMHKQKCHVDKWEGYISGKGMYGIHKSEILSHHIWRCSSLVFERRISRDFLAFLSELSTKYFALAIEPKNSWWDKRYTRKPPETAGLINDLYRKISLFLAKNPSSEGFWTNILHSNLRSRLPFLPALDRISSTVVKAWKDTILETSYLSATLDQRNPAPL